MQHDNKRPEPPETRHSAARRREILQRIGKASMLAGAAASPMAAMATGSPRKWCKHPIDTTRCVQASISGMGSVVLSAQASNEVCGKKCSHYSSYGNWPSSCSNGTSSVTCNNTNDSLNTKFCVVFKCNVGNPTDSNGVALSNPNCLLNKSLATLCRDYSSSPEAHWATAFGNANKLAVPATGAPFPYTPAQVVNQFLDLSIKASAYTFYTTYCENYT